MPQTGHFLKRDGAAHSVPHPRQTYIAMRRPVIVNSCIFHPLARSKDFGIAMGHSDPRAAASESPSMNEKSKANRENETDHEKANNTGDHQPRYSREKAPRAEEGQHDREHRIQRHEDNDQFEYSHVSRPSPCDRYLQGRPAAD
jgi:hypothetical protein